MTSFKLIGAVALMLVAFTAVNGDYIAGTTVVNYDLAPSQRWNWVSLVAQYNESLQQAASLLDVFLPAQYLPTALQIGEMLIPNLGDYGQEIVAFAKAFNFPVGKAVLLNLVYEIEAACTSIIAQTPSGQIYHSRNLDFDLATALRNLTIQVEWVSKGKTIFTSTTYVGYVGVLTGASSKVSISLNQRNTNQDPLYNLLQALIPGTRVAAFLIRDILASGADFTSAVNQLGNTMLIAPCYLIAAGTNPGEGVVITRDRESAELWHLDLSAGRWFLVQTNDDHNKPPKDHRRDAANKMMSGIGQQNINSIGLFKVLSTPPVLSASMTTYTTSMSAGLGIYNTTIRY